MRPGGALPAIVPVVKESSECAWLAVATIATLGTAPRSVEDWAEYQMAYRELFRYSLEVGFVDQVRQSTNAIIVVENNRYGEAV